MSNTVQDINSIAPLAKDDKTVAPKDQVQVDYEEGKKFLENNNPGQAAVALHNALLGFEEKGDEAGIANASNQLGHACLARKDYAQAEKYYLRTQEICRKLDDPLSLLALAKQFVEVYRGLKDYGKAIETCLGLLDAYHRNNDPKGTVGILEDMAEIYVESDDRQKAADTYRTIASIHRNFNHQSIADSFAEKARELGQAS